jgi:hypothetical protein
MHSHPAQTERKWGGPNRDGEGKEGGRSKTTAKIQELTLFEHDNTLAVAQENEGCLR